MKLSVPVSRPPQLYAARCKIEDCFDELQTGGFADCRQRSFPALKRHTTLCVVAYSLLQLLSGTLHGAQTIEAEPWWCPAGPPSVTRSRRTVCKACKFRRVCIQAPTGRKNTRSKKQLELQENTGTQKF